MLKRLIFLLATRQQHGNAIASLQAVTNKEGRRITHRSHKLSERTTLVRHAEERLITEALRCVIE